MIFKQIHSLPISPNWGKITLITIGVIVVGCIVYNVFKPVKVKIEPKPEHKTE